MEIGTEFNFFFEPSCGVPDTNLEQYWEPVRNLSVCLHDYVSHQQTTRDPRQALTALQKGSTVKMEARHPTESYLVSPSLRATGNVIRRLGLLHNLAFTVKPKEWNRNPHIFEKPVYQRYTLCVP